MIKIKRDEDNELRLIAAEIIRQLWESRNVGQLEPLQSQVRISLEDIAKRGFP